VTGVVVSMLTHAAKTARASTEAARCMNDLGNDRWWQTAPVNAARQGRRD
jgi:hypothetical protein